MLTATYIILWLINAGYSFARKNNRLISFLTYVFLGVIFSTNAGQRGDAEIYAYGFLNQYFPSNGFETGYTLFEKMIWGIGIHSYTGLLIALFLFGSIFLWIGLKKWRISYHSIFAMIMPFIFPTWATAIRFFVGCAIMVAAVRYLTEGKTIRFLLLVTLAGSFHTILLFNLVFVIYSFKRVRNIDLSTRHLSGIIAFFAVGSSFVSIITKNNPLIPLAINGVSHLFNISTIKLAAYSSHMANWGGVLFILIWAIGVIVAYNLRRKIRILNAGNMVEDQGWSWEYNRFAEVNFLINLMISIALPFAVMNLLYYRLLIIGSVTNAIAYSLYIKLHPSKSGIGAISISLMSVLILGLCLSWFVPEIIGINDITINNIIESTIFYIK